MTVGDEGAGDGAVGNVDENAEGVKGDGGAELSSPFNVFFFLPKLHLFDFDDDSSDDDFFFPNRGIPEKVCRLLRNEIGEIQELSLSIYESQLSFCQC